MALSLSLSLREREREIKAKRNVRCLGGEDKNKLESGGVV